jgi:hypothetical protein
VARFYTADKLPHLYWSDDLARTDLDHLIPPAHDNAFYPDRHPRVELLEHSAPAPATLVDACGLCATWLTTSGEHVILQQEVPHD